MPPITARQVSDDSALLRRIRPDQVVFDSNLQRLRPSSAAFTDPNMSIDIVEWMAEFGLSSDTSLQDYPDHSLARFTAKFARDLGLAVEHTPLEENPVHGEVTGKKTKSIQNKFATQSEWERLHPNSAAGQQ